MNKQVKDIAIQAGASERSMCYGHGDYRTELVMTDEVIERFAELLVRKSMEVTKTYTSNQGLDYSAPVALARHFGVAG